MKLWLTRQANGQYMLTEHKPTKAPVGQLGYEDVYVTYGDSIGLRNVCPLILRLFGVEYLSRGESIEVEIEGRKL